MTSRFRILFNRLSKFKPHIYPAVPAVMYRKQTTSRLPYAVGFSIFTWLGFDSKLTAEDELIDTIKHCVLFIQKNDYVKAEQLLHVALRQAQQVRHENGITYIYDIMANLALEREQLDKAKQLFVAVAQRIMSSGATEDDSRVVHISMKLARVSHLQKDYSTAQIGYDWCLTKLRNEYDKNPSDQVKKMLAMAEDWYGRLFVECNQCEQGFKLMQSAMEKMRDIPDVETEHIVVQLNDLGMVCDRLERYDESISYFNKAIALGKTLEDNSDLGVSYVNLGRVFMKQNLITEARKHCGYGLRLALIAKNEELKKEAKSCLGELNNLN